MEAIAYLTKHDALLCKACALNTADLLNDGRNHLLGLTAVPAEELYDEACCEECKTTLAPVAA